MILFAQGQNEIDSFLEKPTKKSKNIIFIDWRWYVFNPNCCTGAFFSKKIVNLFLKNYVLKILKIRL